MTVEEIEKGIAAIRAITNLLVYLYENKDGQRATDTEMLLRDEMYFLVGRAEQFRQWKLVSQTINSVIETIDEFYGEALADCWPELAYLEAVVTKMYITVQPEESKEFARRLHGIVGHLIKITKEHDDAIEMEHLAPAKRHYELAR